MKKYKIHVIQNCHTDIGYTHRQEYVCRAHARYLNKVLEILETEKDFKWTMENFWMYENFKKWSSEEDVQKLKEAIKNNQVEITGNYLNILNILDKSAYAEKVKGIKKEFPHINVAVQQDINSIDKEQAIVLSENGVENIYASIHTHHGMFVGEGKQRGFIWDLENGKKITVWGGEHYMLGNELFLNLDMPNKYTFKDQADQKYSSGFEQGLERLQAYLDLLDEEKYPYNVLPIVLSGKWIDNSPPNEKILEGVKKLNEALGDRAELKCSSFHEFFKELDKNKLPTFKGYWPSWWIDGAISTPEEVRQYREAQILYKNIKIYDSLQKGLPTKEIKDLEEELLLFSEHTWGSWSSTGQPFSNGNNLLLSRKLAMSTKASSIAWNLWDEIKEQNDYNIVKRTEKNEYKVVNIHNEKIEKVIGLAVPSHGFGPLEIDRYVNFEDAFEIIDEKNNVLESAYSLKMGLDDNLNTSIESDRVILLKISLLPQETKTLKIRKREFKVSAHTSSFRQIGVDNADDIVYKSKYNCKYLRNGIESPNYIIKWNSEGVFSIFDKDEQKELLEDKSTIRPVSIISKNDPRTVFGRNRQGPSAKYSFGELVSHKILFNKDNVQIVKLFFEMEGSKKTELDIRVSSLDKKIRFQIVLHKEGTQWADNVYLTLPFKFDSAHINSESSSFEAGKEQLPNTNLDYYKVFQGAVLKKDSYQVGLYLQDLPLLQLGSLKYEQRFLMDKNVKQKTTPMIWIMSNYWETNFKGTLEGAYSFAFDVSSSKDQIKQIRSSHKKVVSFKIWD